MHIPFARSLRILRSPLLLSAFALFSPGCIDDSLGPHGGPGSLRAAASLKGVDSLAASTHPGLRLMSVLGSNVNADGTADLWQYLYVDMTFPHNTYTFRASAEGVALDDIHPTGVGAAVISHEWFDSGIALWIAEKEGGARFRVQHPQCTITASLGEPVVPDAQTTWHISYWSTGGGEQLVISINASTGAATVFRLVLD